jgi:NADPH-dependent curcumin reductase CurA
MTDLPTLAVTGSTGAVGGLVAHGLAAAEEFRVVTFGGMSALLDMLGRKR